MTAPRAIFRSLSAALLFWHGMAPLGLAASDADDCTEFAARAREALQKFTHKTLSRDEAAKTAPSLRAELFTYLPRKERPTSLCYETALLITQLSLLAEWDTATVAQTELEKWWGQLEGLAPEFARGFTLRTSSLYLNRWMASDPIPLLTFIAAIETRIKLPKGAGDEASWRFKKQLVALNALETIERQGIAAREQPAARSAQAILSSYWIDPSINLTSRTQSVLSRARELHSQARFSEAASLMDSWMAANPSVVHDIRFCFSRFCTAHHGEGNRPVARRMLGHMDELIASHAVTPETWEVKAMTEAYYKDLLLTSPKRLQRLADFATETAQRLSSPKPPQ